MKPAGIPIAAAIAAGTILAALFAGTPVEGKPRALPVGSVMPDFALTDSGGKEHILSALAGKVVVLDFLSQTCPYSRGSAAYLSELAREYAQKGVVFLGVDSHKSTTHAENAAYKKKAGIPYPILRDERNAYADAVGATRTPEIYLIDKSGTLVYQGAVDDRKVPTELGETPYLKNALDEVLAGKSVSTPHVSAWGCSIKRLAKRPPAAGK